MKIRFLNRTIEHQRFNYNPMYYDERKEQLASKKKLYKELEENDIKGERRKEILEILSKENTVAHSIDKIRNELQTIEFFY